MLQTKLQSSQKGYDSGLPPSDEGESNGLPASTFASICSSRFTCIRYSLSACICIFSSTTGSLFTSLRYPSCFRNACPHSPALAPSPLSPSNPTYLLTLVATIQRLTLAPAPGETPQLSLSIAIMQRRLLKNTILQGGLANPGLALFIRSVNCWKVHLVFRFLCIEWWRAAFEDYAYERGCVSGCASKECLFRMR